MPLHIPPISLDGDRRRQLRLALESASPGFSELAIFIQEDLAINPNVLYSSSAALSERVSALITWACAKGKLDDLVRKAFDRSPGNPELTAFLESLRGQHAESTWMASERARLEELEACLKDLSARRAAADADGDTALSGEITRELVAIQRKLRRGPTLTKGERLGGERDGLVLRDIVGEGSYATVWQAHHPFLRKMVAVKVLHAEAARDPSRVHRFRRGAVELMRLSHPHLARVYEADGEHGGFHYVVMDYYPKGDLFRAAARTLKGAAPTRSRIGPREALLVVIQAADGLRCIHENGLIHRDVKPSNILIDHDGSARLSDFDTVFNPLDTGGTHVALGTPAYMAPEVVTTPAVAKSAADIYSLGMTALFAISGTLPPMSHEWRKAPALDHIYVPEGLKRAILCAIAPRPESRYPTVKAFRDALAEEHEKLPNDDPLQVRHRIDAFELLMFAFEQGNAERARDLWPIAKGVPSVASTGQAAMIAVRECAAKGRSITASVNEVWPGLSEAFLERRASAPEAPDPVHLSDQGEMLDTLLRLPDASLDEVVFRLEMEHQLIEAATVEKTSRDLVKALDAYGKLDALGEALSRMHMSPLRGGPPLPKTWQEAARLHLHATFFTERLISYAPSVATSLLTSYVEARRYEEISSNAHDLWRALRALARDPTRVEELHRTFDHLMRIVRRLNEPWPRAPKLDDRNRLLLRRIHLFVMDELDCDLATALVTAPLVPSWALPKSDVRADHRARVALRWLEAWSPNPAAALETMLAAADVPLETRGLSDLLSALQTGDLTDVERVAERIGRVAVTQPVHRGESGLSRLLKAVGAALEIDHGARAPIEVDPPSHAELCRWYEPGVFDDLCFAIGAEALDGSSPAERVRALMQRNDRHAEGRLLRASFDALVSARRRRWRGDALLLTAAQPRSVEQRGEQDIVSALAEREDDAIDRVRDRLGVPARSIPGPEAARIHRAFALHQYCDAFPRGLEAFLEALRREDVLIDRA